MHRAKSPSPQKKARERTASAMLFRMLAESKAREWGRQPDASRSAGVAAVFCLPAPESSHVGQGARSPCAPRAESAGPACSAGCQSSLGDRAHPAAIVARAPVIVWHGDTCCPWRALCLAFGRAGAGLSAAARLRPQACLTLRFKECEGH
ncbi:unnamed protein product [Amoebophrya sp. A120]|nr:unnamed protein product [Amoebophrya sp. A120]|eukprot:GSA120T00010206001.1